MGWMVYNDNDRKYVQVRSQKGGGSRVVEVRAETSYGEMMEKGKALFFPNGIYFFLFVTCDLKC